MDLSNPIHSVIPSAHGAVLGVLARTEQSMSGRRVAELTGRLSARGTLNVLHALVEAGLVEVEEHPPSKLYRLNRRHLAAESICALAQLRTRLIDELSRALALWDPPAAAAWLFGSAARGDGDTKSDVDVLLVRPDEVDSGDESWLDQVDAFAGDVTAWSGNPCAVLEYSEREFADLVLGPERLADELRRDGVRLIGEADLRDLRRRKAR